MWFYIWIWGLNLKRNHCCTVCLSVLKSVYVWWNLWCYGDLMLCFSIFKRSHLSKRPLSLPHCQHITWHYDSRCIGGWWHHSSSGCVIYHNVCLHLMHYSEVHMLLYRGPSKMASPGVAVSRAVRMISAEAADKSSLLQNTIRFLFHLKLLSPEPLPLLRPWAPSERGFIKGGCVTGTLWLTCRVSRVKGQTGGRDDPECCCVLLPRATRGERGGQYGFEAEGNSSFWTLGG